MLLGYFPFTFPVFVACAVSKEMGGGNLGNIVPVRFRCFVAIMVGNSFNLKIPSTVSSSARSLVLFLKSFIGLFLPLNNLIIWLLSSPSITMSMCFFCIFSKLAKGKNGLINFAHITKSYSTVHSFKNLF